MVTPHEQERRPQLATGGTSVGRKATALAGRKDPAKEGQGGSPVPTGRLAIAYMNDRRQMARLPLDDPRRTPTLPKIDLGGEER